MKLLLAIACLVQTAGAIEINPNPASSIVEQAISPASVSASGNVNSSSMTATGDISAGNNVKARYGVSAATSAFGGATDGARVAWKGTTYGGSLMYLDDGTEDNYLRGGKTTSDTYIGDVNRTLYLGKSSRVSIDTNGKLDLSGIVAGLTSISASGTIQQGTVISCSLGLTTTSTGAITGCVSSSIKLKKDVKTLAYNPNLIDSLRPVTYLWKDRTRADKGQRAGFIAEEMEKVFPQATAQAGLGIRGVDPNAVIAALVKEVQELRKRVAALEAR